MAQTGFIILNALPRFRRRHILQSIFAFHDVLASLYIKGRAATEVWRVMRAAARQGVAQVATHPRRSSVGRVTSRPRAPRQARGKLSGFVQVFLTWKNTSGAMPVLPATGGGRNLALTAVYKAVNV
jgi:hypothetical protein